MVKLDFDPPPGRDLSDITLDLRASSFPIRLVAPGPPGIMAVPRSRLLDLLKASLPLNPSCHLLQPC